MKRKINTQINSVAEMEITIPSFFKNKKGTAFGRFYCIDNQIVHDEIIYPFKSRPFYMPEMKTDNAELIENSTPEEYSIHLEKIGVELHKDIVSLVSIIENHQAEISIPELANELLKNIANATKPVL